MSTYLTNVSITTAGLNELVVYGANGLLDGPTLTCSGGSSVEGRMPVLQGGYDISSPNLSLSNVTCFKATSRDWTFQVPNLVLGAAGTPDQAPPPVDGAR